MAETRLEVIYSVTSTTYTTQLFNVTGNFVKAELADDTELPDSIFAQENKAYLFDQTGLTSVFYTLCGNTLVNDEFAGMTRIVGVNVPSTVTSIPERCFRNCSNLSDAYITSSVTSIASGAFENTAIEFFEIPATSVTIGDRVFAGCSALTAITMNAPTAPSVSQYTFYQVHTGGTLTYPSGSDYSSWLSNNEYYLGYYGWTGDTPTPPTPTEKSITTTPAIVSVSSAAGYYDISIIEENCTFSSLTYSVSSYTLQSPIKVSVQNKTIRVEYYGNPHTLGGRVMQVTFVLYDTDHNSYTSTFTLNQAAGDGSRDCEFSNYIDIWLPSGTSSQTGLVATSGCTYSGFTYEVSGSTGGFVPVLTGGANQVTFSFPQNPTTSQREAVVGVYLYDTDNYIYGPETWHFYQSAAAPTPTHIDPWPEFTVSAASISSGAQTVVTYMRIGHNTECCTGSASVSLSSVNGSFSPIPQPSVSSFTLSNGQTQQITFTFPENTGAERMAVYGFDVNFEEDCQTCGGDDIVNHYTAQFAVLQASGTPTPSASISFRDSATTMAAKVSAVSSTYLTVCGCTLDTNRPFEIVSVTGNLPLSADSYYSTSNPRPRYLSTFNPGSTERSSTVVCRFYDTSGNSYTDEIIINQEAERWIEFDPLNIPISSSAQTVCTNILVNNFGEPYEIEFRNSGMTGFTEFPTPVLNNNTLCMDIPENLSDSGRTLRFQYGISGTNYVTRFAYVSQSGASTEKDIRLHPENVTASSGATSAYTQIYTSGCSFSSFTITNRGGQQFTIGDPYVVGNELRFNFPVNSGASRSETFSMQLFDTEGNSYNTFFILSQEAKGTSGNEPDPWSDTGDTAYTWYRDDSLLRILPSTKILAATEVTGYWPVTAHTFNNVGVRASGDVAFTYELLADGSPEYNSHSLYAYTEDNTGTTQQVSTIKLVAFSGTSAYSASTVLMKNPDSHGWITASPNPVNAASQQNSVNVYLTLTNCQRNINKEATDNVEFDEATWVTVTRVNNTTLTFNFQANSSPQLRATYYYAYGLDTSGNNVYCRIDINQSGNSMGVTITPDRSSLGKPAGSFTARVESTESGNFSFSASPWMVITSYVPESQYGGTLYIDYYENNNEWPRTGNIWVTQQISTSPYTLTATTVISQTNTADTAYIRVTPSSISVDRTAGVVEAQVSYGGLATVPEIVQNDGNMSIISYDLDSNLITVAYGANDTSMDKYKNFTVTAMSTNGNVIAATFSINQGGTGLPVAPIWRDYVLTLPTPGQGYINYNVSYDGTIVYTGRAYSMGQDNIELFYNHICKPFLSNHIDFTEGYQSIREWLGNFIITSPELGDITSVSFFEDYSYENREIQNVMSLNNPIINEVVEGSYVPFSFFITGASGNVSIMQNGQQLTGLTINDNEQHRYFIEAEYGKTYTSLGTTYKTISGCDARYSLYYINSYGGVDVLPFKGRSFKKTDNITRLNYSRSFRNNTLEFENVNYMNEMKPAWELNTSYMVDSQSRKMHELVESTTVYLYDALENTYTPVVMTDKKLEYKTYFNQGRKFYTYTINVEESQSKERR